ncbi:adenylyltransferase/cytidyltransferase family protein [Candidatus Hecatella orcuttiae]|jgi:FAD synthetase|uniref:adenylyltransferase/cytidyltransferase family protein n=1 Tax=Candidatus Hecatella orcuttiae TaxID=1935119 RepID=UPI002867D265|nr:adenylyltransferase/cytidyltransferase family protein [Candidatus Hecatella orcuttiae]
MEEEWSGLRKRLDNGRKRVLASGVFDLLHLGHARFLQKAKEVGGKDSELLVVVARDSTVKKLKGSPPVLPEKERRALVEMLKPVDKVVLGSRKLVDIEGIIRKHKPDIIALGYDQDQIEAEVKRVVAAKAFPIQVVRIQRFGSEGFNSSSKIKELVAALKKAEKKKAKPLRTG